MNTQNQVEFITGKIQQLQTAILHSHSNCLLKFPDSLANTLQVDEVGCVWIAVKNPQQPTAFLISLWRESGIIGCTWPSTGRQDKSSTKT